VGLVRTIRNPILPGFDPDPSICRVGGDHYIATSTFEWYPDVQIHRSRNLVDWRLVARPLRRASQLDLRGDPDSGGVRAPCLSHADGRFWLVCTDVKRLDGAFKDAHDFVVTATDVAGDWSEPVHVKSSGFDPTLFHDDDGRKWFLNLLWNHRASSLGQSPRHSPFGGIVLQEYDASAERLVGEPRIVFTGSERGLAEGPHLFRRDGRYYLVVAEGGTGYEHAVMHARSRRIDGPYELHPDVHVITADPANGGSLQRAGHGQVVETPAGEWYHTHLSGRPLALDDLARRRCTLGLVAYYGRHRFHFLQLTRGDEELGRVLRVMSSARATGRAGALTWRPDTPVVVSDGPIATRCDVDGDTLRFAWRSADAEAEADGGDGGGASGWRSIGGMLDASLLADEAGRGEHASFTGAFLGMLAFDLTGHGRHADFLHFGYEPR